MPEELAEARTAVVTGARGFAGRHLVELLLRETAWRVIEVARRACAPPADTRRRQVVADLRDVDRLGCLLAEERPAYVFHLAAAMPPASIADLFAMNVGSTSALLETVSEVCPQATVLVVGSDAQYGRVAPEWLPTPETAPQRPLGPYGRSKVLQEVLALRFHELTGLRIVCVRPFNYTGPGQGEQFVVPTIARQIALAECSRGSDVVQLGNADAWRDFTDVRDVVRAYVQVLLHGQSGEVYNIGSGTPRRIGDIAALLTAAARTPVTWRSVPARRRRHEVASTQCDASRLRGCTGWAPAIPLEQTLADTLDYWRQRVEAGDVCTRGPAPSGSRTSAAGRAR
jgi:GDP-4-dehydro-6-deoxy-D-mannose reductase